MKKLKVVREPAIKQLRVKLIQLPDLSQAVIQIRDTHYLQMTIYSWDSQNKEIQFVAPFAFESEESRNEVFNSTDKLKEFASSVLMAQMAKIDPKI